MKFLADAREVLVPGKGGKHGPLPPLLIGMTLVTGLVDAFSYLVLGHVFVANMTGNVVFLGFALGGSPPGAGYRYALIALLGLSMGIQNAAARALAVPDLTTTVLTLTLTGIAADSALGGGSGSRAGRRLVPVVTMLLGGLIGAVLVLRAQPYDALAIALLVTAAGATASRLAGRSKPEWVHP